MDPKLIFDVGMHKGEDTEFYLKKGFRVIAIEAVAEFCTQVGSRLRPFVDSGQLTIVNCAVSEHAGPITFYLNEDVSVWGTTSQDWANRNSSLGARSRQITVSGVPFRTLVEKYGVPYYLKIDIEGADMLCIQALEDLTDRPKHISIESEKRSWRRLRDEFSKLGELGYHRFKVVQQLEVQNQVCPSPPREGDLVDHKFEKGSTGLFGEEAPGQWLSARDALRTYRRIFVKYFLFGDNGIARGLPWEALDRIPFLWRIGAVARQVGWYDTHASL